MNDPLTIDRDTLQALLLLIDSQRIEVLSPLISAIEYEPSAKVEARMRAMVGNAKCTTFGKAKVRR